MTTYTVPAGRYGDYSTAFIQAYIDAKIAGVLDSAPETLDTLNELAEALGDDPAFLTTMASANTTLQTNIDNLSTAAASARTALQTLLQNAVDAVQADVDTNETTSASAVAAEATARGTAITNLQTTLQGLIDAVQADVDANELASDNAEAALSTRLDTLEADPTTATALAAVQSDVDQNESDSDAAETALSGRLDVLEADPTTATAVAAVQSDVDQNEADADAAIALKLDSASPAATGTLTVDTNASLKFDSNLTKVENVLRGTSVEIGNNIQVKPAASGGRLEVAGGVQIDITEVPEYSNDSQAEAGGVIVGGLYRSGSVLHIRVS